MPSRDRSERCRIATLLLLALLLVLPAPARAGRRWQEREKPTAPVDQDLRIAELQVDHVSTAGARHRVLIRALVENRGSVDRTEPWRLVVDGPKQREPLATCAGDALPQGQVALCEMWVDGNPFDEGQTVTAWLDRRWEGLGDWDADPDDDRAETEARSFPPGGEPLRIVRWEVRPRILHGMGEVQFRFTVEGAHLVWLLAEGHEPRLLAGHPADGLVSGNGTERITTSGPVTLVARNSIGAFVYQTIPVLNSYRPRRPHWSKRDGAIAHDVVVARLLEPGVVEVSEDELVLGRLSEYLSARDWASALDQLRRLDERRAKPQPASVLNPESRDR